MVLKVDYLILFLFFYRNKTQFLSEIFAEQQHTILDHNSLPRLQRKTRRCESFGTLDGKERLPKLREKLLYRRSVAACGRAPKRRGCIGKREWATIKNT